MIFIFAAHYGEVENIIKRKKMGNERFRFPFCSIFRRDFRKQKERVGKEMQREMQRE